jgi:NSS family neurotransmitter:Na+ symporter
VFCTEILIGRATHQNPADAFYALTKSRNWYQLGKFVLYTGLLVSGFYSVITGWILGYLVEANFFGNPQILISASASKEFYASMLANGAFSLSMHGLVILICLWALYFGVRKGIERISKILMPLMIVLVLYLVYVAVNLPNALAGLSSLLHFDWHDITSKTILAALGQAFFTLSLGQGTMITYGSYLAPKENILKVCLPIVVADTIVSLLSTIMIFSIIHSTGVPADVGLSLLFKTIPNMFGSMPFGSIIALVFFVLVAIAALTSEMSAIEPMIAYFIDHKKFSRHKAVVVCCSLAFIVGIPSALSYSSLVNFKIMSLPVLEFMEYIATGFFVPISAMLSAILMAWIWKVRVAAKEFDGEQPIAKRYVYPRELYFTFCVKYLAPLVILIVSVNGLLNY